MPLYTNDPFHDPAKSCRPGINPFMEKVVEATKTRDLSISYGEDLRKLSSDWNSSFKLYGAENRYSDLVVEIGSHKGTVLNKMAEEHPECGFIGMDITFKRIFLSANRAKEKNLSNVINILSNANGIDQLFPRESLSGIVIFFPDPWMKKKRQEKNRLVSELFSKKIHKILKPDGFLWIKTDYAPYFDDICSTLDQVGFTPCKEIKGIPAKTYTSNFENMFQQKNCSTHEGVWVKKTTRT